MASLLLLPALGCASHKPSAVEPRRPVVFTSADGRITVTVHGDLARKPAKPSADKRLERFLYGPDDEPAPLLRRPQGLACASGFLYVADQGFPDVIRYDLAEKSFRRWIRAGDRATCPVAVAADESGRAFIADAAGRSVMVFDGRGRREPDLALDPDGGGLFRPSAVLIRDNVVHVADAAGRKIHRFDRAKREWLAPFGPGAGDQALAMPAGLAMTSAGELLVTDAMLGLIHRFDADGKPLKPFGEYGGEAGQLIRPQGIAVTPSGFILVADAGRESVVVFDKEGVFVLELAGPSHHWAGFIMPSGVASLSNLAAGQGNQAPSATSGESPAPAESPAEWFAVSDLMRGSVTLFSLTANPLR